MLANALNSLAPWSLVLLLAGLGLALAFRRARSAWLLACALVAALAPVPALAAAWVPVLVLWIGWGREPGLWSLRSLIWGGVLALGWAQAQGDGGMLLRGLATSAASVQPRLGPIEPGSLLVWLAAACCLVRWTLRGLPIELGNAAGLAVLGAAVCQQQHSVPAPVLYALAGIVFGVGVLWSAWRMAFIDPLTGLANRRALDERLARSGWRLALAMVDVDFFKKLNDRYGHDSGDVVLRAVARELGRTRGAGAYRYGGEEFCLVFAGRALRHADAELESLRTRIEALRVRLGHGHALTTRAQAVRKGSRNGEVRCTVSIGLADRAPERRTVEAVLKAADDALYRAKQKGRNRVVAA